VVSTDGGLCAADLDRFCREGSLADFKRPRTYRFLAELPRNATGKLMRRALAERRGSFMSN
jgi:acyl-coenzyme A synthetase/AMP-(fatty) acid ligase